ncbi:Orm1 type endoplasmic reticulum protein [Vararia minispora EC-137]|uniref:Orm1 type endoplasmic reticulum protein n=1 Tax=Vararia minispora EC-137 TaxID=1314806 RepID=A0ACB8QDP7_9AGAM|nr:Orm1 type endoplasmic reticulum protein [Vararia minispora EC-137]
MTNLFPSDIKLPTLSVHTHMSVATRRGRSNSLLKVEHVRTTNDEDLDQAAYSNLNAEWVNRKGAWAIHVVLIVVGKVVIDTIPGITQNMSWTALSYLMFHWVTGIPFQNELHGGAYDDLTLWEQIDGGAQYTPAKKWLFSCPVALFLLSTHYTNYDPWLFAVNLSALILVLIPKLPMAHRSRLRFLPDDPYSAVGTPTTGSFPPSGATTPLEGSLRAPPPQILVTEEQFR